MSRDINLPSVVSVLPKNQQQWINDFMINDLKRAKISDPAPSPGSNVRGFCGRTLAGAMMASEARRKGDMRTFAQVDSLLRRSDPDAASSMIETGLMEIKAFSAATDVAHDAGLGNVSKAVDYAVVKAVSENNPSVRRAMSEAGSMPRLDPMLIQALIDMPVNRIVLLTEVEAVEKAMMLMSFAASLYVKYFGVLLHLAESTFKEWDTYARPVSTFWDLFRKGYVVLGTAFESTDREAEATPYVCAKLRNDDTSKGGMSLLEI